MNPGTRLAILAIALWLAIAVEPALAYTGGPLRVVIDGFEPREAKVFYHVDSYDESGLPSRVYYLDLRSRRPARAVRAVSLEDSSRFGCGMWMTQAWQTHARRLVRLPIEERMAVSFRATSTPLDGSGPNGEPRFLIDVEIESGGLQGHEVVEAWCGPLIRVQGLYRIPGRTERLIVLTRIGRAYGCEEVELPVLLR